MTEPHSGSTCCGVWCGFGRWFLVDIDVAEAVRVIRVHVIRAAWVVEIAVTNEALLMVEEKVTRQHGWSAHFLWSGVLALCFEHVFGWQKLSAIRRVHGFGVDALPGRRAKKHAVFGDVAPANRPRWNLLAVFVFSAGTAVTQFLQILGKFGLRDLLSVPFLYQCGDGPQEHGFLRSGRVGERGDFF